MDSTGFHCLADEDTVRGFRSAGVPGEVTNDAASAARALAAACAQPAVRVIILTEPVAELIRSQVEAVRQGWPRPLIVEIPGPAGPLPSHRGLRHQVQAAAGMTLEWQEPR